MPVYRFPLEKHTRQPYLPIRLSNPFDDFEQYHHTLALIDTGADYSIIPSTVSRDLMHDNDHRRVERRTVIGIGGPVKAYKHTFTLEILDLDGEVLFEIPQMLIEVSEKDYSPVILGMKDFIIHHVKTIDFSTNKFTIYD